MTQRRPTQPNRSRAVRSTAELHHGKPHESRASTADTRSIRPAPGGRSPGCVSRADPTGNRDHRDRRLAKVAITLLEGAGTIGLTDSNATDHVVQLLATASPARRVQTVVTNSLRHAELIGAAAIRNGRAGDRSAHVLDTPGLLLLGGQLGCCGGSFHGPGTVAQLKRIRLDVAVVTATGVTTDGFTTHAPAAEVSATLLSAATRRVILVDGSCATDAAGQRSITRFNDLATSDHIVVGADANRLAAAAVVALAALHRQNSRVPGLIVVQ